MLVPTSNTGMVTPLEKFIPNSASFIAVRVVLS